MSTAALGISASVLPTTTRAEILRDCGSTVKSIEGCIVSTALFLRSAGFRLSHGGLGLGPDGRDL